ncbi:MAG: class I SAM-dependent methyltransferase [Desulfobacteraceae bacterium]|nr:class I SAM-dependent methyltransferase [Desulfobacteraceae bacterium]
MTSKEEFNEMYETGVTPWELNRPDSNLINMIETQGIIPCKILEIGCGTGSNAIWLARQGFDVVGTDFSALAIEQARQKAIKMDVNGKEKVEFIVNDFLSQKVKGADFDFLFDRGCFHSFEALEDRTRFAQNAHAHLNEGGQWLSLIGNADAPKRDEGPPMRSAKDIVDSVEAYFEILSLVSHVFDSKRETPPRNWVCYMQKRK